MALVRGDNNTRRPTTTHGGCLMLRAVPAALTEVPRGPSERVLAPSAAPAPPPRPVAQHAISIVTLLLLLLMGHCVRPVSNGRLLGQGLTLLGSYYLHVICRGFLFGFVFFNMKLTISYGHSRQAGVTRQKLTSTNMSSNEDCFVLCGCFFCIFFFLYFLYFSLVLAPSEFCLLPREIKRNINTRNTEEAVFRP